MAVETAADRAAMLADFGQSVTYTHSGSPTTLTGIFDNEFYEADAQAGVTFVSAQPRLVVRTADLPNGADYGDTLVTNGITYTVKIIQADGTGITTLVLEKQ